MRRRAALKLAPGLALLAATPARPQGASRDGVLVFAAASLTEAMGEVAAAWTKSGQPAPRLAFGASSALARQIEQGAPAGVFFSADERWMDYLAERRLIVADTRRDLLANRLVLVVPADRAVRLAVGPDLDLAALLGPGGRLAVGDPAHVPAGIYARQALIRLGLWDRVAPHLAPAEDVRAALLLVERGEAPAGIVYATDAAAAPGIAVAGEFPPESHDPIRYPAAVIRAQDGTGTRALLGFMAGPAARAIFARRGFTAA